MTFIILYHTSVSRTLKLDREEGVESLGFGYEFGSPSRAGTSPGTRVGQVAPPSWSCRDFLAAVTTAVTTVTSSRSDRRWVTP